jgi:hypothetical protein
MKKNNSLANTKNQTKIQITTLKRTLRVKTQRLKLTRLAKIEAVSVMIQATRIGFKECIAVLKIEHRNISLRLLLVR